MQSMNGAETLVRTLLAGGIDVCFANPGTSEMQFVAALDRIPGMRCVLALFEGVATGAADGYARMTDRPASTLLHLAPGLANGLANLHNAKRAQVPVVNIVGEHRQGHKATDSPLTGDIEGVARTMSYWMKTSTSADDIAADAAEAIREANALPGRIATLILPADTAWTEVRMPPGSVPLRFDPVTPTMPSDAHFDDAIRALRSGENTTIVLAGRALRAKSLELASKIAQKTGARLIAPYGIGRLERGIGRVEIGRIPAVVDAGVAAFKDARHVILIGAKVPAPMFGYPGKPDVLVHPNAQLIHLASDGDDLHATLSELVERLAASQIVPALVRPEEVALPEGELTPEAVLRAVAALMPSDAIIADESITAGRMFFPFSRAAPQHDYLQLTGGSLGCGIPMATGAAIACPDRKVINMEGDGSSLYTLQGLWTQARERLNVLTIVFANRGYQILKGELRAVGAEVWGERAERMLSIADPDINWVKLAEGMGVEAGAASTAAELVRLMKHAMARPGPFLIEARIGR